MNKTVKGILLSVPAVIIVLLLYLVSTGSYNYIKNNSSIASLLISSIPENNVSKDMTSDNDIAKENVSELEFPDGIVQSKEELEAIPYGTNWATLNIDQWETVDIPVYFGDTADILAKGAGQWIGSYFCGLGKNCIISANVMTWFYEIEDTPIGASVTMETLYGNYEYEVTDKYSFAKEDLDMLYEDLGQDTLILHTSYPRTSAVSSSNKRIALICTLKNGVLYSNKYDG